MALILRVFDPPTGRPHWRNWAGNAQCRPTGVVTPTSEDEVAQAVSQALTNGQRIKALGAGHSFTPIAVTDGLHVDLSLLSGVLTADVDTGRVTLLAGTRLADLPRLLGPYRLALENMGDIDCQTISGAISTGTHGTGGRFVGLAGQVRHLRIVLEDGSIIDTHNGETLFAAAVIGLGAIGIITAVTLQCVPAFTLRAQELSEPLLAVVECFGERVDTADHFEFYWFPGTEIALTKTNTRLPADASAAPPSRFEQFVDEEVVSNGIFGALCALGWAAPALVPGINRLAARFATERTYSDISPAVFTSPRRVRFREMEFAIPRERLSAVFREVQALIRRRGWRIGFPLEVRAAAADNIWLSTAYGRDTAYVAVHRYHAEPFAEYFLAVQRIMVAHGGRPHWGKLHTLDDAELRQLYPKFDDFLMVRNRVAPFGLFRNDYLDRVLGQDRAPAM